MKITEISNLGFQRMRLEDSRHILLLRAFLFQFKIKRKRCREYISEEKNKNENKENQSDENLIRLLQGKNFLHSNIKFTI